MNKKGQAEVIITIILMVIVASLLIFFLVRGSMMIITGRVVSTESKWKVGNAGVDTKTYMENITDEQVGKVIRNDLIKAGIYTFGVIAVIFIIMFFRYLSKRLERQR